MPLDEDVDVQNQLADLVDDQDEEDRLGGLTHEQALAELAKVRREAAGRRVSEKQLKADMAELQKYRDAEKTELERLTERAEKAERIAAEHAREKTARAAAKNAGLDPDLWDVLRGSTEEELAASAENLAQRVGTKEAEKVDPLAGFRGGPVRPAHESNNEAFRALFG